MGMRRRSERAEEHNTAGEVVRGWSKQREENSTGGAVGQSWGIIGSGKGRMTNLHVKRLKSGADAGCPNRENRPLLRAKILELLSPLPSLTTPRLPVHHFLSATISHQLQSHPNSQFTRSHISKSCSRRAPGRFGYYRTP